MSLIIIILTVIIIIISSPTFGEALVKLDKVAESVSSGLCSEYVLHYKYMEPSGSNLLVIYSFVFS